ESLDVLKGRLFFNIDGAELSKHTREFRLKTPPAILAVKGTRFFVQTDGANETVGVHQGTVLAQNAVATQTQSIAQGNAIEANKARISEPKVLTSEQAKLASVYSEIEFTRIPS